jgi:rubrerythrin
MKTKFAILALVLAGAFFTLGRVTADEQPRLHPQTVENLSASMHGEAFAYAKYLLFAQHARQDGNTELADLFEKTAAVEHLEHMREQANLAGIIHGDIENLKDAIKGENHETESMYPRFAHQAQAAGDHKAAKLFEEIANDEAKHRDAFRHALTRLENKHDNVPGQ